MPEIIRMGGLELRFLESREGTGAEVDLFEMTLQPGARMPIPHFHESWDETVYGLSGRSNWRVGGRDVELAQGESLFIARGIVHGFTNDSDQQASCLCLLTPGVLGPAYFREIAGELGSGAPDPARMKAIMLRYCLVPSPQG
jgi:quercetin dioxygenase-like cupin family protein